MSAIFERRSMDTRGPDDSLGGRTLGGGRFQILVELGRGGRDEVYRAFDRDREQEVALKILAERYAGRPEFERRFVDEARCARRVAGHPHVVTVWDDGVLSDCGGRRFMTLELVEGPSLAMELAAGHGLPVWHALRWALQIAAGLRSLHEAGIVHRDLTPSNVLVDKFADVLKLFDFGRAVALDAPAGPLARAWGEAPGTHGYMAPEQVSMHAPAQTMDVYAFGVVLTEMLVGENPFVRREPDEPDEPDGFIEWSPATIEPIRSRRREGRPLPDGVETLIDQCLRRDPAQRPRDGAELVARLDTLLRRPFGREPVVSVVGGASPPPSAAEDAERPTHTPRVPTQAEVSPRRWVTAGLLAVALGLLGLVVGWWLGTMAEPGPPESRPMNGRGGFEPLADRPRR